MALNSVSLDEIEATADSMLRCSEKLSQAAQVMRQNGLDSLSLHWSETTYSALQRVLKIGPSALENVDEAVWAKKSNRPSLAEKEKARAARDNAKRKKPEPSSHPKKRGRPPKAAK